jgi:hypothetical protein
MLSLTTTKVEVYAIFKMAAVAILESQVRSIKWVIIAQFQHACFSLCTKFHQISVQKQQISKYAE